MLDNWKLIKKFLKKDIPVVSREKASEGEKLWLPELTKEDRNIIRTNYVDFFTPKTKSTSSDDGTKTR